jgi:hypothetical protein
MKVPNVCQVHATVARAKVVRRQTCGDRSARFGEVALRKDARGLGVDIQQHGCRVPDVVDRGEVRPVVRVEVRDGNGGRPGVSSVIVSRGQCPCARPLLSSIPSCSSRSGPRPRSSPSSKVKGSAEDRAGERAGATSGSGTDRRQMLEGLPQASASGIMHVARNPQGVSMEPQDERIPPVPWGRIPSGGSVHCFGGGSHVSLRIIHSSAQTAGPATSALGRADAAGWRASPVG